MGYGIVYFAIVLLVVAMIMPILALPLITGMLMMCARMDVEPEEIACECGRRKQ